LTSSERGVAVSREANVLEAGFHTEDGKPAMAPYELRDNPDAEQRQRFIRDHRRATPWNITWRGATARGRAW